MGDLVAGDYVFTDDGTPTEILQAHPIHFGHRALRVMFEDGQSLIVNGEHLWTVQDENQRKNSCRRKVRGVEQKIEPALLVSDRQHSILTTDAIIERGVEVPGTRSRSAFNRFSVLAPLPVEYPEAELPVHPYVLGCWLGDGAEASGVISKPDIEMFDRIRSFGYEVPAPYADGLSRNIKSLLPGLRKLGVWGNKHVPDEYLLASVGQRWELLRGLMDTDGTCDERGQAYFDNTNKRIIDGVVALAFSLGLKPTVTENRAMLYGVDHGPVWTVFLMARDPLFTIPRKAIRQNLSPANHARHRYIKSIEPVESVPMRCITVASPSGIFLAGRSYIPTHNSIATKGIILPHAAMLPQVRHERFYDKLGQQRFDPKDQSSKPRNPDIALFGPSYTEPRVEFQYIEDELRALGLIPPGWKHLSKPQDGPWRLTTAAGVVIATWSMDDPGTIRAMDLEMAAICEAGKCPYEGVERVRGRVSAQKGPVVYSGTLEESHQWYRDWAVMGLRENKFLIKTYSLPTWTNLHNFPGGRQDSEILLMEATYPDDVFAMRVAGEPRPPRHRVMKEVTEAHVKVIDVTQMPGVVFEICVDPGYASAYAVLLVARWKEDIEEMNLTTGEMQKTWRWRFHFVDEFYEQGRQTEEMIDLLRGHPLWPELNAQHEGVFDIASKGHRDAGQSALEIWKKRLPKWNWNMKYWYEEPLIERLRTSAKANQFTISPNCKGLLAECGLEEPVFPEMHPWKYMTTRDGIVSGEKPIDKWNHSCKAAGYYLLHHLGQVERITKASNFNRLTQNKPKRNLASTGKR
ncbi:MAG: LAGLIDADG family homing endonuclease [Phycisphaerae bacterium]